MESYWEEISSGYEKYHEEYPEQGMVRLFDSGYPFREAVRRDIETRIAYNEGPLERECLVTLRDDIPPMEELPMTDLARIPILLTRILQVQRLADHDAVWQKAAGHLIKQNSDNKPLHDPLVRNFESLVRALLSSGWSIDPTESLEWDSQGNERFVVNNSSLFARYMAYPTLEGMIKSLSRRDIDMDGSIRSGRKVLRYDGIDHYPGGDECSHLGHLLWHLEKGVAKDPLKSRLEDFRNEYAEFFDISPKLVYGDLYNNRNTTLHGELKARAEFGMLLNLMSLVIFNIDSIPENRRTLPD